MSRLFVPNGADDRRASEDYKSTRIGFVVESQPQSAVELVSFDAKEESGVKPIPIDNEDRRPVGGVNDAFEVTAQEGEGWHE